MVDRHVLRPCPRHSPSLGNPLLPKPQPGEQGGSCLLVTGLDLAPSPLHTPAALRTLPGPGANPGCLGTSLSISHLGLEDWKPGAVVQSAHFRGTHEAMKGGTVGPEAGDLPRA